MLAVAALLLTSCGGKPATAAPDTQAPVLYVTSGASSTSASYVLTGVSVDDTATTTVTVKPGGGATVTATLDGNEFSAPLTLQPGVNSLLITASDAAGNSGEITFEVVFEAAPGALTVTPDIALPGEELTISGSAFGDSGTVDIGGVAASVTDWTGDSITLTVPAAAGAGPQTLTVHGRYGSSTVDLFIGVDFPTGDMGELAALALPPGTAVRLGAATYPGGPPGMVVLEGISLYGRGPDQTTLAFGDAVGLEYFAASGQDLEIADLSLVID